MIFVALLSEKLLMYGGKFFRKDFFVSRQSFLLTNHGGRGIGEPEKKSLTWRSSSIMIASETVGMSMSCNFPVCETQLSCNLEKPSNSVFCEK